MAIKKIQPFPAEVDLVPALPVDADKVQKFNRILGLQLASVGTTENAISVIRITTQGVFHGWLSAEKGEYLTNQMKLIAGIECDFLRVTGHRREADSNGRKIKNVTSSSPEPVDTHFEEEVAALPPAAQAKVVGLYNEMQAVMKGK